MTEIRLRPMYRWLLGLGLAGALILMLPIRVAEPESEAPKTIRSNDAAQVVVPASVAQLVGDPLGGNDLESNANRGRSADNLHAALLNDFNNLTNGRAFAEKHGRIAIMADRCMFGLFSNNVNWPPILAMC